ncbi:tetratricopeptide repeat protein [Candidatus Micrarchaeota archaeon]|nr:tetratricopeptide repeat protein [Candidatus Micrarchaeota archaeon]
MGNSKKSNQTDLDEKGFLSARMHLEKRMGQIGKLLASKNFSSEKEANAYINKIMNSDEPFPQFETTPLEKAQELMYEAWESNGKQRIKLARKALEISKNCADAYVLLAEEALQAGGAEQAKTLYQKGVEAGERAIGKDEFTRDAGHFWGITETRPYMRARHGLANCQWNAGAHEQAIAHYADMLRLNPDDNQGIRYVLLLCLLEDNRNQEAGDLLKQYDDCMADWAYSKALWAFRTQDEKKAAKILEQAIETNRFVPDYLLGKKKPPTHPPEYISPGEPDEAVCYADAALQVWKTTPGALEWLSNLSLQ